MATEDHKYQRVRGQDGEHEPEVSHGNWETLVHDCVTPSLSEIKARSAAVGTLWRCGGEQGCGNPWKLILHTKHPHGSHVDSDAQLHWIRIIKDNGE